MIHLIELLIAFRTTAHFIYGVIVEETTTIPNIMGTTQGGLYFFSANKVITNFYELNDSLQCMNTSYNYVAVTCLCSHETRSDCCDETKTFSYTEVDS